MFKSDLPDAPNVGIITTFLDPGLVAFICTDETVRSRRGPRQIHGENVLGNAHRGLILISGRGLQNFGHQSLERCEECPQ